MVTFTQVQKCMGITLTAGFVADDYEFSNKFLGATILSIVFLLSLAFFHALIFLREINYLELIALTKEIYIYLFRALIFAFIFVYCFSDYLYSTNSEQHITKRGENILEDIIQAVIIIIPEVVFRIIFLFKKKTPNL